MATRSASDMLLAAAIAGALSGAPSTVHAVATGTPVLAAARTAGELLGRPGLVRGAIAHTAMSLGWSAVLSRVLPGRNPVLFGALAGYLIARLDLGIADRHFPLIAALPRRPQIADHIAFGALAGAVFAHRSERE